MKSIPVMSRSPSRRRRALRPSLTALLALLLIAAFAPAAQADESAWLSRVDDAVERAAKEERYILVDLYAEWCGWCQIMEQEVFASAEFQRFAADLVLLRVDTEDRGEGSKLRSLHRVDSLPATLILNADQVRVGTVSGFKPIAEYVEAVRDEIKKHDNLLAAYGKVLQSDRVALQRRLAEDLHARGDAVRAGRLYERVLSQAEAGSAEAAWLHYSLADVYRLGHDFVPARENLERARDLAAGLADGKLLERADLLRYYVERNAGDCGQSVAALERYLERHPESESAHDARRFLAELRKGVGMECS